MISDKLPSFLRRILGQMRRQLSVLFPTGGRQQMCPRARRRSPAHAAFEPGYPIPSHSPARIPGFSWELYGNIRTAYGM